MIPPLPTNQALSMARPHTFSSTRPVPVALANGVVVMPPASVAKKLRTSVAAMSAWLEPSLHMPLRVRSFPPETTLHAPLPLRCAVIHDCMPGGFAALGGSPPAIQTSLGPTHTP